jgi:hypothetical protein
MAALRLRHPDSRCCAAWVYNRDGQPSERRGWLRERHLLHHSLLESPPTLPTCFRLVRPAQRCVVNRLACYLLIALGALFGAGAVARAATIAVAVAGAGMSVGSADGCLGAASPWQGTDQGDESALSHCCRFRTSPADHAPSSSGRGGTGEPDGPSGDSAGPEVGIASAPRVSIPVFAARFLPEDGARDLPSLAAPMFRPPRGVR